MNSRTQNRAMKFFITSISLLSLICSGIAQESKSSDVPVADPSSLQGAPTNGVKNEINSSDAPKASSSNSESSTNEVVPTDPSMVPPPVSTESPTNTPLPVDPNAGEVSETPSEESSPVNNTESVEKKKHEVKVRYNEVRTQVEKEEPVAALRQAADKATTPEGQRQTLKAYYELLFKRMKQIDPSLTERCDVMQGAYLRRLEQKGLEPTIPLQFPDNMSGTNAPTHPLPKAKVHKKTSPSNPAQ